MATETAKEKRERREAAAAARKEGAADAAQKAAEATAAGKPTSEQIAELNKQTILRPDKVQNAHGAVLEKTTDVGGVVFVGCKVGVPYIDLQLSQLVKVTEQTQTGAREVMQPRRFGPVVRIRGTAYPRGTVPDGFPEKPDMAHGCAINPNIDREFMIAWLDLNKLNPLVTNSMIFIGEKRDDIVAKGAELAGIISGFEPLNPKADPRTPRSTNAGVSNVETEDERAKKMRATHA